MRRHPRPAAASLALALLVAGAGCATYRPVAPRAPMPGGGWIDVAFGAPRAIRATWADGTTTELDNVSAVRGQLVAAEGDTVTLRVDVGGGGLRVGAGAGPPRPATGLRGVTLVLDAETSVRQLRVSASRTSALLALVPAALVALKIVVLIVCGGVSTEAT